MKKKEEMNMSVSIGFYRKLSYWVLDEQQNVVFRPFLTNGNPYKARVFVITSNAQPKLVERQEEMEVFIESLVDYKLLNENYSHQLKEASKELRGMMKFCASYEEVYNEPIVISSLNTLQVSDATELKTIRKNNIALYERGVEIFEEVLQEFKPKVLILQGNTAINEFINKYKEQLMFLNSPTKKVQQLEAEGPLAQMFYEDGEKITIFATRSMSFYTHTNEHFALFKQKLNDYL